MYGNGIWRECPVCGKLFMIGDPGDWVYKRNQSIFFCKWSCMRSWDAQHKNDVREKRVKAALARHHKECEDTKHKAKPVVVVRTRSSVRYCGFCGTKIRMTDKICSKCGTLIDWSDYEGEVEE